MALARRGRESGKRDKSGAMKLDHGKARFELIPARPLQELALLYGRGAIEYGDRNWERGLAWGRMFGAMMRHAWKFWNGEELDPQTKVHHMTVVAWYALCLRELTLTRKGKDDRP